MFRTLAATGTAAAVIAGQIPADYAVATAILTLGLAAARHVPDSGAFHSSVVAALGRPAGVATAMVALTTYNAMQIGLYGAFAPAAASALAVFGVHAYWGAWILAAWLAIGILGLLRIRIRAQIRVALLGGGAGCAMSAVLGSSIARPTTVVSGRMADLAALLIAAGVFAAMLTFHSTVARCTLILARERVLPRALARTRDDEAAVGGSVPQSMIAICTLLTIVTLGVEPTAGLFFYGAIAGGIGLLILVCVGGITAVRSLHRSATGDIRGRRRIAPIISTTFPIAVLLPALASLREMSGRDNPVQIWSTLAAYALVAIGGAAWAQHLKRSRPAVYAAIGQADRAFTIRPPGHATPIQPLRRPAPIRPPGHAITARPTSEATALRPRGRAIATARLPHRPSTGDECRSRPATHLNGR